MKPGDVVADRFQIERLAGSGGMGAVFRALDLHTGDTAALKVMWGRGLEHTERFAREAHFLANLRHPGIVRYLAHGSTLAGEPYIALEWLEGESLAERLRRRGLTVAESVTLGLRVAEALGEAHRHGIVHRDLKPSNLHLVDKSIDRVKILDFGIARIAGAAPLTITGVVVGTPFYMAPEQARGDRDITSRADVFALGCVLFHCLTGTPPFAADEPHAALLKVVLDDAPHLHELRADVPEALDELVRTMLSKDPSARPADGHAVADQLLSLGDLGSTPPAPISRRSVALTTGERRVVCLLLARLPPETTPQQPHAVPATLPMTLPMGAIEQPQTPAAPDPRTALRRAVGRFRGDLQAMADGLLLITLENLGVTTDEAARAARCALEVRALMTNVQMALVAGRGTAGERVPMGATIDRAVRLLDRASGGTIRLDDVMAGLLDARFDIDADSSGLILRAERELTEAARTLLGRPTPFVGRDHEIAILRTILEECVSEPTARAVLITAPAGIGKSRLRYEFLRQIHDREDPVQVWIAYGDHLSAGSPFGMLAQILRREAGLQGSEPQEVREQRLRARIARHLGSKDVGRVTEFLGEIAGIRFSDADRVELRSARSDPMLMGDQMRRVWDDFLLAESRAQPILIVLEDLQWGDLPTVKFIDAALRTLADLPLMVVALGRPEVENAFPDLWASRAVQQLRLREIGKKGSEKLIRQILGDKVNAKTIAHLIERSGGNAFYLEELIRAAASGRTEALPETVLAMVQARLESLDIEARRVLRAASIFGQVFWRGGLISLLGGPLWQNLAHEWLVILVERELIARHSTCKFPGEEEYVFRHALVRETAYATLTDADRALGHHLAGEWLETAGERNAVLLAEHYERGAESERAVIWFRRAAEQALEGNDFHAAIAHAERGIVSAEGEFYAALRLIQAEAHKWLGEAAEAEKCAVLAMQHFPPKSALWYAAAAEAASMRLRLGMSDRLADLVEELHGLGPLPDDASGSSVSALARIAGSLLHAGQHDAAELLIQQIDRVASALLERDFVVAARIYALRASRALCYGDPSGSLDYTEQSIPSYLATGDLRNACLNRVNAAHCAIQLGAYDTAEPALKQALADAERMRLHNVAAFAKQNLGLVALQQNQLPLAKSLLEEAITAFAAQANHRQEGRSHAYLSLILTRLGDLDTAEHEIQKAIESLSDVPTLRALALSVHARVLLEKGSFEEALSTSRDAVELLVSLSGTEEGEALIRLTYTEALRAAGHIESSQEAMTLATQRLVMRAQKIQDLARRASFCELVPENARTFALAAIWNRQDILDEKTLPGLG